MIERLQLRNFKGFSSFSVTFGRESLLVGPNSAGKSTIIEALRAGAQMMRSARHRAADRIAPAAHDRCSCYTFSSSSVSLVAENLRHEFRSVETQLDIRFNRGAHLRAVWPVADDLDEEDPEPFFILWDVDKVVLRRPRDVRRSLPDVAVVPSLSPVEHEERILDSDYVRGQASGRLASHHARNHLDLLKVAGELVGGDDDREDLKHFLTWAEPWLSEIKIRDLQIRMGDRARMLDLYCREPGSHSDRELFWVGDGMQVWVQLLVHLYRARAADTVILDEPDLYLHADLQRRLVRLLENLDAQTIAASHSSELLAEAAPRAVTWISKERRSAVRAPNERLLGQLSDAIGSQFNLSLARALRARVVLFVEGDDLSILRHIADTCGVAEVARETALVTVPLRGYSNWEHVEPFSWLLEDLLDGSVKVLVLLDRDYRTERQCQAVRDRLHKLGIQCHIWRRKELESYLLVPSVISRLSGAPVADVEHALVAAADQQRESVFARQLAERTKTEVNARRHAVDVTESHQRDFEKRWSKQAARPHWCNAKELLASLNKQLASEGHKPVGANQIARKMRIDEVPDELAEMLNSAESLLTVGQHGKDLEGARFSTGRT